MQNGAVYFEIVKDIVNNSAKFLIQLFPICSYCLCTVCSKPAPKSLAFEDIVLKYCLCLIVCSMRLDEICVDAMRKYQQTSSSLLLLLFPVYKLHC